jgi:2-polyprenyl-3-methyl-5-hydroxy-6-metoxy-1,4-benzoquinol methylase
MQKEFASTDLGDPAASFRDPAGRLLKIDGQIIRIINRSGAADLEVFLASATAKKFTHEGRLVSTEFLNAVEVESLSSHPEVKRLRAEMEDASVVRHEAVPFTTYPYEWPAQMLHAAGSLTLDLAESLLDEGMGLKDATPYNILFRGPTPVFVDLLSFERRDSADPVWLASAQFERTFLLPLLLDKRFGISPDRLLLSRRDGIEPEDVYRLCGPLRKLAPPFLTLASIPTWLAAKRPQQNAAIYQQKKLSNPEKARFILRATFKRLRRLLKKVEPDAGKRSSWSDYMNANNYSDEHFQAKCDFVESVIDEFRPRRVLDVGCNTGHFSLLAARAGARVVAIDYDAAVAGEAWRRASAENLDVLPLRVDLSRPSPATGWRNRECASFLDRTRGGFDAVLMLALIHHLMVTERIPLDEIIEMAAELTTDLLIIEFIAPADSMFRAIARGRDHLFVDFTENVFEAACRRHFDIVRSEHREGAHRRLYLLRKKAGPSHA